MPSRNMKTIAHRIAKLEATVFPRPEAGLGRGPRGWRTFRPPPPPIQVRFGHLRRLPADFPGERHVEIGQRLPDRNGQEWVEFEEVPGPAPIQPPQTPWTPLCIHVIFV
jgi:hypothetical protein